MAYCSCAIDKYTCSRHPITVKPTKLWPMERILFEANQVASKHWEKPITLNSLADVRYWLRSSINPKDKPPRLFLDSK